MIVLACLQALVAILIGIVLLMRKKRGWGWALIAIGVVILGMALIGLASFSP
jgi:glucose uptake protein GlcU